MANYKMTRSSITLPSGRGYSLGVVKGDRAYTGAIRWHSNDYSIADVDSTGYVTAISTGWTTIYACIMDGSGDIAECNVIVDDNIILVDSVNIYTNEIEVEKGKSTTVAAYINPINATYKSITWVSENEGIVTIQKNDFPYYGEEFNATVTGKSPGSTFIYAYSDDGSGAMDGCQVTVPGTAIEPTKITIDNDLDNVCVGDNFELSHTIHPFDSTKTEVKYTIENNTGKLYQNSDTKQLIPVAAGEVTLTATIIGTHISDSITFTIHQTSTKPTEKEPAKSNEKSVVSDNFAMDPIDLLSGAQIIKNNLLSLFGGQGTTLTAHYNSTKLVNGSLGKGWYHNFEKHIEIGDCKAYVYESPTTYNLFTCREGDNSYICNSYGKAGYVLSYCYDGEYELCLDCNSERYEYYDSLGRLAKVVDRHGFETLIAYSGSLVTVTDTVSGKSIYLVKDTVGKIVRVHDGLGRETILEYDGDLLVSICDVNNNTLSYCYDSEGRIKCGIDAENICYFENTYDEFGRIVEQRDGVGSAPTYIEYLGDIRVLTNRNGCKNTRVYNDLGQLISFIDENGNTKKYEYDENGNVVTVTDANNNSVTIVCNRFNKPLTVTDKNGNVTEYQYDSKGNVVKVIYPNGSTETFAYNSRNQVVTHTDRRGTVTVYTYDENGLPRTKKVGDKNAVEFNYINGLLMSQVDALGNEITYCYNDFGQPEIKTDALGNKTYYEYDKSGNVLKATDANGGEVSYTYDGNYNKKSFTDANNNTTRYDYNGNLKLTKTTLPDGNVIRHEYDGEDRMTVTYDQLHNASLVDYDFGGRVTAKHDAEGYTTEYSYDVVGNITEEINAKGGRTTKTYDAAGNVITVTDPQGNTVRNWYDCMSKVVRAVDPILGVTLYEYSPAGDLLSTTDALGNKHTFTYDDYGNKISETDAKGNVKQFVYDANNNLVVAIDALRSVTTYTYDACNRLVSVTDAEGHTVSYEYDALGNKTAITDGNGNTVRTAYDHNGNVLSVTDAKGNRQARYEYNELNLATAVTDALDNTTEYCYNEIGKVRCIIDPMYNTKQYIYDRRGLNTSVIDAFGNWSTVQLDGLGKMLSLTGPTGAATRYTYDKLGRLVTETTTAGNTLSFEYNALSQKSGFVNGRGQKHSYAYDSLGRMKSHQRPEDIVSYTYDENSNVVTVTDKNGTVRREFDELNRVTKYTDTFGNEIGYEYDKIGNVTKLTYPDGTKVHYTYDANNNLTSVTDWAGRKTTYTYDQNNTVTKVVKPDGSVTTTTYDKAHRVTSSVDKTKGGAIITGFEYTFDNLGRIVKEKHLDKNTIYWYNYDGLGRVVHKTIQNIYGEICEENYDYDAAGNIRCAQLSCGDDTCYEYTANNRLSTVNGYSVTFDADGNMISYGSPLSLKTFHYDSSNRLLSAMGCEYTYNAENTRIKSVQNGIETTYTYNTVAKLSQLLVKTTNGVITKYVYGLGLIGQECNNVFKTYHFDYRGSTVALIDSFGNVSDRFEYDTYGKMTTHNGSSDIIFLYNGRDGVITDANGLYYMRARYYSPELRRFVNADILRGTISDSTSLNRYAYVNGNPVSGVDPRGLCRDDVSKIKAALDSAKKSDLELLFQNEWDRKLFAGSLSNEYNSVLKSVFDTKSFSFGTSVTNAEIGDYNVTLSWALTHDVGDGNIEYEVVYDKQLEILSSFSFGSANGTHNFSLDAKGFTYGYTESFDSTDITASIYKTLKETEVTIEVATDISNSNSVSMELTITKANQYNTDFIEEVSKRAQIQQEQNRTDRLLKDLGLGACVVVAGVGIGFAVAYGAPYLLPLITAGAASIGTFVQNMASSYTFASSANW